MIPISPPLNPSQAVERLREIIVGRQFDQFEKRIRRLEIAGPSTGLTSATSEDFDDRLSANEALIEARFESMHENMQQLVAKAREQTEHLLTSPSIHLKKKTICDSLKMKMTISSYLKNRFKMKDDNDSFSDSLSCDNHLENRNPIYDYSENKNKNKKNKNKNKKKIN